MAWQDRLGSLLRLPSANGNGHLPEELSPRGLVIKAAPASVAGQSGLRQTGGFLHEEQQRELRNTRRWMRIISEMRDNDPVVGAELYAIEMLIRRASWDMDSFSNSGADLKVSDFVWSCLNDMQASWHETLAEVLSFLPYGWALLEVRFKQRHGDNRNPDLYSDYDDGKYGWHSWEIRSQDTLWRWEFDQSNHAEGLHQQVIEGPNPGLFYVPFIKCGLFRNQARRGNPEGRSILRNAYRPWLMRTQIENVEGIGIERDLAGMPIAWVPAEFLKTDAPADMQDVVQRMQKLVTGVKRDEQEGLVMPLAYDDKGHKLYDFSLINSGGSRQLDTSAIVQRYNQTIAMTVLADFILLGHTRIGSFALASSKTALFAMGMGVVLDEVADVVNRQLIPPLLRLNGMDTSRPPKLRHGDVESVDLAELGQYITALTGAGMPLFPSADHMIENWALAQAGMPVPDEDQWAEQEAQAQPVAPPPQPGAPVNGAQPPGGGVSPISGTAPPKTPPPGTPGSSSPWPGPGPGRGHRGRGGGQATPPPAAAPTTSRQPSSRGAPPGSPAPVRQPYKPQPLNPISSTQTMLKGDQPGHDFHGNQYTGGTGDQPSGGGAAEGVAEGAAEGAQRALQALGSPRGQTGAEIAAGAAEAGGGDGGLGSAVEEAMQSMVIVPGGVLGGGGGDGSSAQTAIRGGGGGGSAGKGKTTAASKAKKASKSKLGTSHSHGKTAHVHPSGHKAHVHVSKPRAPRKTKKGETEAFSKGEASGHEFRGNQYTGGIGGAQTQMPFMRGTPRVSEPELPLTLPAQTPAQWPSQIGGGVYVKAMGGGHMNLAYHVYFGDGTQGLYKPLAGADQGEFGGGGEDEPDGADGQPDYVRSSSAYTVAEAFAMADMVPRTVAWTPPAGIAMPSGEEDGIGSLQAWQGGAGYSRSPDGYLPADVEKTAVFDYVTDNTDRHANNYMTSADGRPNLTDNDMTFGVTFGSSNDRAGFMAATDHISPDLLKTLGGVDQAKLGEQLSANGLRQDQIDAALTRLNSVIEAARRDSVPWPTGLYLT